MPRIHLTEAQLDLLDSALCTAIVEARNEATATLGPRRALELKVRRAGLVELRQKLHAADLELEAEKLPVSGQLALDGSGPVRLYPRARIQTVTE
jgi:hypothetical protein